MWSFKLLEVVCQKDYALNFQNFTTIENGFQKFQIFSILTTFCVHGWLKWSCRTSTTTSRVLETNSLRVTPFPFVRRAMGTANSFKTKRSKLKSWISSGNQVAFSQSLMQTVGCPTDEQQSTCRRNQPQRSVAKWRMCDDTWSVVYQSVVSILSKYHCIQHRKGSNTVRQRPYFDLSLQR